MTELTVTVKVSSTVESPSSAVTVIVEVPNWFKAPTASIDQFPDPRLISNKLPLGISAVLLLVAVTNTAAAGISTSSTLNASGPVVPSSEMTWFPIPVIVGSSLIGLMDVDKVVMA